jgi:hypothetical protein
LTLLTRAMRDTLLQDSDITALVGGSSNFPNWIFADKSYAQVENSQTSMIVIQQSGGWTQSNLHNTMKFPRLFVDVWSDPTRNANDDVMIYDADEKIDALQDLIFGHFHTVNLNVGGYPIMWGTADQIATRTGQMILGSQRTEETTYSDVTDGDGARMGSTVYGVNLP